MKPPHTGRLALWLGALVAIGPFAIDTYLPALPAMALDLNTTTAEVERSVGLYMIGAAVGQLFGGPMSDRFGRKGIAIAGLMLFALTSIAIAFSPSVLWLDALRIVQAIGGSVTAITSAATVRDHFQGREAARMITAIGMVMLIAPLIAPAVGTVLIQLGGWQLIFFSLAVYGLFLMAVVRFALPGIAPAANMAHRRQDSMTTRWRRVLGYRPGLAMTLCNAFAFSAIFVFIVDSAFLYLEFYQAGQKLFPFLFGANVVAMILFNRLNVLLLRRYESFQIMTGGLAALWLATLVIVLQLLLLQKPPLATVVPNIMLIGGLVALIMPNGIASLLHFFPRDSGTASGLNGATQFLVAGAVGVLLTAFHNHTPVPMALVMFGSATIAAFMRWLAGRGHDLREPAPSQLGEMTR